jgi:hypothetical protein
MIVHCHGVRSGHLQVREIVLLDLRYLSPQRFDSISDIPVHAAYYM